MKEGILCRIDIVSASLRVIVLSKQNDEYCKPTQALSLVGSLMFFSITGHLF
jgi:hypothetical protein